MRIFVLLLCVALVGCTRESPKTTKTATPKTKAPAPTAVGLDWQRDVLNATEPVLVDFTATWCGPCRMMEPALASLSKQGYKVVKVDVDENPALAASFEVRGIPHMMIFHGGEVVARHSGITPESRLRADLDRFKK